MTTITKKRREQIPWNKGKKVSEEISEKRQA